MFAFLLRATFSIQQLSLHVEVKIATKKGFWLDLRNTIFKGSKLAARRRLRARRLHTRAAVSRALTISVLRGRLAAAGYMQTSSVQMVHTLACFTYASALLLPPPHARARACERRASRERVARRLKVAAARRSLARAKAGAYSLPLRLRLRLRVRTRSPFVVAASFSLSFALMNVAGERARAAVVAVEIERQI